LGWRRLGAPSIIYSAGEDKFVRIRYSSKATILSSSELNINFKAFGLVAGLS
jgi:hypothetical protein